MKPGSEKNIWKIFLISGLFGIIAYTAHVVIGGILWDGYSHITQTISELTADGAPNAGFLRVLTTVYAILVILFSFCLYNVFNAWKVHKVAKVGSVLLIVMEITSFVGYYLFPLDQAGTVMNFQNLMHIVVTAIVVICTIGSSYCIGIGLMKTAEFNKIGIFVLICALIITVSGMLTPITMANHLLISGLAERLNIFTLQTWIAVLSVYLFFKKSIE